MMTLTAARGRGGEGLGGRGDEGARGRGGGGAGGRGDGGTRRRGNEGTGNEGTGRGTSSRGWSTSEEAVPNTAGHPVLVTADAEPTLPPASEVLGQASERAPPAPPPSPPAPRTPPGPAPMGTETPGCALSAPCPAPSLRPVHTLPVWEPRPLVPFAGLLRPQTMSLTTSRPAGGASSAARPGRAPLSHTAAEGTMLTQRSLSYPFLCLS